jgi:uncharacterized protein (TIGR02594 family)
MPVAIEARHPVRTVALEASMSAIAKSNYAWLDQIEGPLPRMVLAARALHGVVEVPGKLKNSPVIMDWAQEIGGDVALDFVRDEIPWCGLFMALVARRAGKTPPKNPLWALNWSRFGEPGGPPELGDVLTFVRDGGGHVGLYFGEDSETYHVLGGNQSDCVCFTRIEKVRLRSVRQPPYMSKPASARPFLVQNTGAVSTDEA